jgi:hypothetical protein
MASLFSRIQFDLKNGKRTATAADVGKRVYTYGPAGNRIEGVLAATEKHEMFSSLRAAIRCFGGGYSDGWDIDMVVVA